ncbi:hypothetical protein [Promicromonospora sp. AC04]|uniref:hypothetical protein n=1 Tax=Promicromonospora sp. AC04 TaxID=2135723 RepID=UPI0011B27C5A|nr:hypothetical protein [Promicromonospora sp. AC04]
MSAQEQNRSRGLADVEQDQVKFGPDPAAGEELKPVPQGRLEQSAGDPVDRQVGGMEGELVREACGPI